MTGVRSSYNLVIMPRVLFLQSVIRYNMLIFSSIRVKCRNNIKWTPHKHCYLLPFPRVGA
ncbi:hypothetical protein BofuT4_P120820.1 [Botrytis cinerea T4]|uniref:Uncharacterized protein n=1 Tax=Botryotinia fuckeliana (strain T4) TaxID=999810 RepID=G2XY39_BOTF4|nr:hypothetical protein BofuT4_P120820.1 [Botrytis cinerea T4]